MRTTITAAMGIALLMFCTDSAFAEPPRPTIKSADMPSGAPYLEFDQPMLTWAGSMPPPSISVEPALSCHWTWSDDTHLFCETDRYEPAGRPATRYRLSIRSGLWSQQGAQVVPQTLLLESQRPTVETSVVAWKNGRPSIEVSTNVDVEAAALREVLSLAVEGGPAVDFELERITDAAPSLSNIARPTRWRLLPAPVAGENRILELRVKPGLRSTVGELPGAQSERILRVHINEPLRLRLAGCASAEYRGGIAPRLSSETADAIAVANVQCAAGEQVTLGFSDVLAPGSLEFLRAHLPPGLRYERSDTATFDSSPGMLSAAFERPGYFLRLVAEQAQASLTIDLPASLTTENGGSIERASRVVVGTGDYPPWFGATPNPMLLPVGAKPPAIVTSINTPALAIEQHAIGAGEPSTAKGAVPAGPRNERLASAPPRTGGDVEERGGFVQGTVKTEGQVTFYPNEFDYGVTYAAFNVTAAVAGSQVLVWVTDWDHARAIADAKVELLDLQSPQKVVVLATAITSPDGTAFLVRPRAVDMEHAQALLIRVSSGGRRSVVPLMSSLASHHVRKDGFAHAQTKEGDQTVWGISDRVLYRAGDTVHYRLWTRERHRNHLIPLERAHVLNLALQKPYSDQTISRFSAMPDAYGSVTGEIRLPMSLHDDDYCIQSFELRGNGPQGVCFRVTSYHVNAMWADLAADRASAREGDTLVLTASAGYYSGGAAVGAKAEFQSLLLPRRLEDAYPKFRDFTFVDPYAQTEGEGGEGFRSLSEAVFKTDANGKARAELKLEIPGLRERLAQQHEKPIPFGELEFTASISSSAGNSAGSAPAKLSFSRYPRFVGIKAEPWLLRNDADMQIDAVVITDAGEAIDDVPVHVVLERAPADDAWKDAGPGAAEEKPVAECDVRSGHRAACPFRPKQAGRYRIRATSEGAAETSLDRYAYVDAQWTAIEGADRATLVAIDGTTVEAGSSARLTLRQPFAKAEVLFTVEHGRILTHWVQRVDGPNAPVVVPVDAGWAPGVTINAIVLDAAGVAFGRDAAKGKLIANASVDLDVATTSAVPPVSLVVDRTHARPRDEVALALRNNGKNPVQITLAMTDDAARALAPEYAHAADPQSASWLGQLASWSVPDWFGLGDWSRDIGGKSNRAAGFFRFGNEGRALETITVTGSNIRAADVFVRNPASDHTLGRPMIGAAVGSGLLRSHFVDTALWKTDLELAPAAEQTVRVRLPDNLTRWRVLAWSADTADAFALAQATIESSLPIEVRSELPARLFPGDRTSLAASVRNHGDAARSVSAHLQANGAGADGNVSSNETIAANGQQSISLTARPVSVGRIDVAARANAGDDADGVAASVEVASPSIHERHPVAGWLPLQGVHLKTPALPADAQRPMAVVAAGRGALVFATAWIEGLRDYPHRCWEQILSRAIGAAAAKRLGLANGTWPDADAVIDEALHAAGQFQDDNGQFHFFVGPNGRFASPPSVYLTAYTAKGLAFLRDSGYSIPGDIEKKTQYALQQAVAVPQTRDRTPNPYIVADVAAAAAALDAKSALDGPALEWLWSRRGDLNWFGLANLARTLSARAAFAPRSRALVDELRRAGVEHGMRRALETRSPTRWPFASPILDQCGVIAALAELDHAADAVEIRTALLRGLTDVFAGGDPVLDTQSSAQCLMALVASSPPIGNVDPVRIRVAAGTLSGAIDLAPEQAHGVWSGALPTAVPALDLHVDSTHDQLLSYVASIEYDVGGRAARPAAVGFSLQREYAVLRAHAWKAVPQTAIREGDWVRVTLLFRTNDVRRFVALTDVVPGGLQPMDLELAGVADLDVLQASVGNSPYFGERRIDDRLARFYSEQVPPGTHEVRYYARAAHRGRYAALPALAELMYGSASVARTASAEGEVQP